MRQMLSRLPLLAGICSLNLCLACISGCARQEPAEPTPPARGVLAPGGTSGATPSTNRVVPARTMSIRPVAAGSARPTAQDLRVMSFNLRTPTIFDGLNYWHLRKGFVARTIRQFSPDVLGTQECKDEQAEFLEKQLPGYAFVGVGRSDGKRRGEMCGIFYRSDRFTLLDQGHFWLSKTPSKPGSKSWGSVFPRLASWVKLRDRDGQTFCFFNTHLDAWGSRARLEQARLLRERIGQIAAGLPVVITGDFNTDEGSAPYRMLIAGPSGRDVKFADTFRVANPDATEQDGTRHDFWGKKGGQRIDWILASAGFQTISSEINRVRDGGRYPSDHFPVQTVLRPVGGMIGNSPMAQIE